MSKIGKFGVRFTSPNFFDELNTRVCSSKPAISIEFNNVDSNNLASYEECIRVHFMIQILLKNCQGRMLTRLKQIL